MLAKHMTSAAMERKYYQVDKTGSLNNVRLKASTIPDCPHGKVLVQVRSVGLNYADIFAILGLYSATPKGAFIPGLEFCGEVMTSNATDFKEGDRVIGVTRFGGYDTHIVADPKYLMQLPPSWSYQQGAAFPVQTLTAWYALKTLGDLKVGQTVLIHSAAGGVGLQANRIAKTFGAFTIGVVGTRQKIPVLQQEGFDRSIVRDKHFRENLREALEGRELNLVLETTGGNYFRYSYEALAPMGRLVAYGSAQFTPASRAPNYLSLIIKYLFRPRIDALSMIKANKSVMAFNLIWIYEKSELMNSLLDEINQLSLPAPVVGHEFDFDELLPALDLFRSGNSVGKIVLNNR
jgi:NADPH:quinone reductase-like Zn-dependent oxidoreductase